MARVLAFVPDLLFGSQVVGALRGAGHEVQLVPALDRVQAGVEVLVVDLTVDAAERVAAVGALDRGGARVLAFYSHVEPDVRALAQEAGFELVVPRSRMAREGGALVARLVGGAGG